MFTAGSSASTELDNTIAVETPEHVQFGFHVAGPARRGLAYLIDLLLRAAALLALSLLASLADFKPGGNDGVVYLLVFVLEWGYYVVCEAFFHGSSPGKRALGLRVVKEGGYALTGTDAVLRNLLRAADFLPLGYAIGLVTMIVDGRFRRLGDLVAGTLVIIEEPARLSAPVALDLRREELEALPSRPPVTSEELEAIELFLRRSGPLSQAREAELAHMLAPRLAARMGVPVGDGARFLALVYARARRTGAKRT